MMSNLTTLSPRQTFEDNMRPAQLLLRVYRLLDANDVILTDGDMVRELRSLVKASVDEDVMLVYNEIFLGLVRERAQMPRSTLRQASLCHLLRQAVVASCTALETYLPALLRADLPIMIRAKGRDFVPRNDKIVKEFFSGLTFSLDETIRLLAEEGAAESIASKIVGFIDFKYLSGDKGVYVIGAMLGMEKPWNSIAMRLNRQEEELKKTLNDTVKRRNDIVHRADRSQSDPGGEAQEIAYAWTHQAVNTVHSVCLALDELVQGQVDQLRAMISA